MRRQFMFRAEREGAREAVLHGAGGVREVAEGQVGGDAAPVDGDRVGEEDGCGGCWRLGPEGPKRMLPRVRWRALGSVEVEGSPMVKEVEVGNGGWVTARLTRETRERRAGS